MAETESYPRSAADEMDRWPWHNRQHAGTFLAVALAHALVVLASLRFLSPGLEDLRALTAARELALDPAVAWIDNPAAAPPAAQPAPDAKAGSANRLPFATGLSPESDPPSQIALPLPPEAKAEAKPEPAPAAPVPRAPAPPEARPKPSAPRNESAPVAEPPKPYVRTPPKLSAAPAPVPKPRTEARATADSPPGPAPPLSPAPKPAARAPRPSPPVKAAPEGAPTLKPEVVALPPPRVAPKPPSAPGGAPSLTPATASAPPGAAAAPAAPGTSSAARDESRLAAYRRLIHDAFHHNWRQPKSLPAGSAPHTKVRIVIARDGAIVESAVVEPSGDPVMDESVARAVESVRRIAPLPPDIETLTYSVIIDFQLD